PFLLRRKAARKIPVKVGKGLNITFRMSRWGTGVFSCKGRKIRNPAARPINLIWLIRIADDQRIGIFLLPIKPSLLSIYPDTEVIFRPCSNLGRGQQSGCAVVKLQENLGIIIETPAFYVDIEIGAQFGHL